MPDLWVNIIIVCLFLTCIVGMLWSALKYLRIQNERKRQMEIIQCRMNLGGSVSTRAATLPAMGGGDFGHRTTPSNTSSGSFSSFPWMHKKHASMSPV